MSRPAAILLAIGCALGATEALAWWWMHPAPAGIGQPVLCYRPGMRDRGSLIEDGGSQIAARSPEPKAPAPAPPALNDPQSPIPDPQSASIQNSKSIIQHSKPSPLTPLPGVYEQSAPMLRCSGGQVFHTHYGDSIGLHLAFFEWNRTDTGSVLEAFRHMPEACLGSLGLTMVTKGRPLIYQVNGEPISFDHTVFREPGQGRGAAGPGPLVHAFRAVWVAGMPAANARDGLAGDRIHRLRTIRLKSALARFRPSHARVIQGAVRGATNADDAWQAFENTMLADLEFETR